LTPLRAEGDPSAETQGIDGETDLREGLAKVAALPERRALRIGAR
jgi:hypothetical protein